MDLTKILNQIKVEKPKEGKSQISQEQYDKRSENLARGFFKFFNESKGYDFVVDEDNKKVLQLLIWYHTQNPRFLLAENKTSESVLDYSFNKGFMICGNVGCGKTQMIKTMNQTLLSVNIPAGISKSCLKIEQDFGAKGFSALDDSKSEFRRYYDDLGFDGEVSYFGSRIMVMVNVIMERYDLFEDKGVFTDFSSNLSGKMVQERYGEATFSRLKKMCNILTFDTNAKDRRK